MKKPTVRIVATDAEIDAAIDVAKSYDEYRPKAVAASYRAKGDVIVIRLTSGVELSIPRRLMQGLEDATPAQLSEVEVVGFQSGLHWEELDVDHYLPDVIAGILGSRAWMSKLGKSGGASRSAAKQSASRSNGSKGGRPRKKSLA